MINLASFIEYSSGKHNVGQLKLSENGDRLEKVNNHVHFTDRNNVQLTAAENRAVREALVKAIANNVPADKIEAFREVLLGGSNATKSLSRDFTAAVIATVNMNGNPLSLRKADERLRARGEHKNKFNANGERVFTAGVKSQTDEAYEIRVNEQLDKHCGKAADAYLALKKVGYVLSAEAYVNAITRGCDMLSGVRDAVSSDPRFSAAARGGLDIDLGVIRDKLRRFTSKDIGAYPGFLADWLKKEVENIFARKRVDSAIASDYSARLFGEEVFHGLPGVGFQNSVIDFRRGKMLEKDDGQASPTGTMMSVRARMLVDFQKIVSFDSRLAPADRIGIRDKVTSFATGEKSVHAFCDGLNKVRNDQKAMQEYTYNSVLAAVFEAVCSVVNDPDEAAKLVNCYKRELCME